MSFDQVRIATEADIPQLVELGRLNHAEHGPHALSEEKIVSMFRHAMSGNGIIAVIGEAGALKAMLILLIDPVWFSNDYQLLELVNFVHPDHRRTDFAKTLIAYAKACADETGLDLTIGVMSNVRVNAKIRLYERYFAQGGAFFVYRPGSQTAESSERDLIIHPDDLQAIGGGDAQAGRRFLRALVREKRRERPAPKEAVAEGAAVQ